MKLIRLIQSKIVKKDNKYQVQSEKGRNLGTYDSKEKAEKRLKQVEMFKHMKSKLFTYDELDKWYEEQLRKQGFPTDEELHKEYDEYVKKIEQINNSQNANLHEDPVDFDFYKTIDFIFSHYGCDRLIKLCDKYCKHADEAKELNENNEMEK